MTTENVQMVEQIADEVGYWSCWSECEKAGGKYVNNMEMHFVQAVNAATEGVSLADIPSKVFGFGKEDTLKYVFSAVMAQSLEDVELKTFG